MYRFLKAALAVLLSSGAVVAQTLPAPTVLRVDSGRADAAHDVTSDAVGHLYVAGTVEDRGRATRFAVVKYSPQGTLLWRAHANSALGGPEGEARAVAVDRQGNVYATGRVLSTTGISSVTQGLLVCFDAGGTQQWSRSLGLGTAGVRVRVDAADRVTVSTISGVTSQFDGGGNLLWSQRYVGAAPSDSLNITDMRLDASGGAVVTGAGLNSNGPFVEADIVTIRYDPQGNLIWQSSFSDKAASDDRAASLDIAADGSVYVVGTTTADGSGELPVLPLLLKYDGTGTARVVGLGPAFGGSAVALGASGDVTVSGNGLVSRFDAMGNLRWSLATAAVFDTEKLALGATGEAYVSGALYTTRISAEGQLQARVPFVDAGRTRQTTAGLHLTATGVLAAAGSTASPASSLSADMVTLRFALAATPPVGPPAAPSNLSARAEAGSITLTWTDNASNELGHRIERCAGNCDNFAVVGQTASNVASFTDHTVTRGTQYRYRVRAHSAAGDSASSNTVKVRAR